MSDTDKPEAARFIRPKDLDNQQRNTLANRIGWRIEAFAWDFIYWYPMKALPITWASNTVAAILRTLGPLTSQHRTMIRNLRMCFPDWTRQADPEGRERRMVHRSAAPPARCPISRA